MEAQVDRKMLVFLGGTVGQNHWRKEFVDGLAKLGVPRDVFFNPVVVDWNQEAQDNEERAKKEATHLFFYLGSPMQDGPYALSAYSMVEATMALYDRPNSIVLFEPKGIEAHALKSFQMAERVLRERFPNAPIFSDFYDAMHWVAATWACFEEDRKAPPAEPPVAESEPDPLSTCKCGFMYFEHIQEKFPPGIKDRCEGFAPQ